MRSSDAMFSIIIFGDVNCGKTSLIQRFLTNSFKEDIKLSVGVNFEVKTINVGNKNVKLQIWDFGMGSKGIFSTYARGAKGGIFMYDITNYFSLAHIDEWLGIIRKEKRAEDPFPIIMVGGKADLEDKREVSVKDGMKIAKLKGMDGFIECSSKLGDNVEKTFEALTRLMMLLHQYS
ncbi:MAG: Rab family GTPase [Candidatus Hermodarchaeota archaeon]